MQSAIAPTSWRRLRTRSAVSAWASASPAADRVEICGRLPRRRGGARPARGAELGGTGRGGGGRGLRGARAVAARLARGGDKEGPEHERRVQEKGNRPLESAGWCRLAPA